MRPDEEDLPSENAVDEWIYAQGVGKGRFEGGQTYMGKWLVFRSPRDVDGVWEQIRQATETGRLGVRARVSTSRPSGYRSGAHVIEVYTPDYLDKAGVAEVLRGLRGLGIAERLSYKREQDTIGGVYSSDGPFTKKKAPSSWYSSEDFEKKSL